MKRVVLICVVIILMFCSCANDYSTEDSTIDNVVLSANDIFNDDTLINSNPDSSIWSFIREQWFKANLYDDDIKHAIFYSDEPKNSNKMFNGAYSGEYLYKWTNTYSQTLQDSNRYQRTAFAGCFVSGANNSKIDITDYYKKTNEPYVITYGNGCDSITIIGWIVHQKEYRIVDGFAKIVKKYDLSNLYYNDDNMPYENTAETFSYTKIDESFGDDYVWDNADTNDWYATKFAVVIDVNSVFDAMKHQGINVVEGINVVVEEKSSLLPDEVHLYYDAVINYPVSFIIN